MSAPTGWVARLVAALGESGFGLEGISTDGRTHRYVRAADPRPVVIDVLAPHGLGPRARLTTIPPLRTIEVPAGTQALERPENVHVRHGARTGPIPRPSLLAAIVKAAACALPGNPFRHERDLALLCALVEDPFPMREQMTPRDLKRSERRRSDEPSEPCRQACSPGIRADGTTTTTAILAS